MQRGCLMLLISLCCIIGNLHKFTLQLLLLFLINGIVDLNSFFILILKLLREVISLIVGCKLFHILPTEYSTLF